ncbi:MAG TPA: hypothetical protein DD725_03140 [Deltaproteobacteria bacterium]|nr:hypothetical protein [Deltaproteobacteria bacterium]
MMRLKAITNYELRITNSSPCIPLWRGTGGRKIVNHKPQTLLPLAVCCLLFAVYCSLCAVSSAAEPSHVKREIVKKEKQLETIKRDIVEKKKSLQYNLGKEYVILEELQRLDKSLSQKEEELENIENSVSKLKQKGEDVDNRIRELIQERKRLSFVLEQRLTAMYKMKRGGIMQSLFLSASINDLDRRYKYINKVVDYDVTLLNSYSENQVLLENEQERLKEFKEEMLSLKNTVEYKKSEIEEERVKKETFLKDIRKKSEVQLAAIEEMEGASKELKSFLDRLKKTSEESSTAHETAGFASMRGHLPMPVTGKVISMYGKIEHPKFRTVTFNNGIEIEANAGAEVKSVYQGRVAYSGWFRGYGKVLIVEHGEGYYTLFAHLSKIIKDVDSIVEKGDVVALVGDTGSIKGPQLYFEVRQKGMPLNPIDWLAYNSKQ